MIHHAVAPRSPEWMALRLGIPCSSEFHKILTPKTGQLSKQSDALLYRLLAEWMTNEPVENYESEYMARGIELEDQAISAYEVLTDTETQPGGFFTDDSGLMGCSPDRLIGEDGDLEIKCPLIQTQIMYALEGTVDADYMCQLQGRLLITGRKYVDIFSYHPKLSIPPIRVRRNELFLERDGEGKNGETVRVGLKPALQNFITSMLDKRAILEQRFGPFRRPEKEEPDHSEDFITKQDEEDIIAAMKENNAN